MYVYIYIYIYIYIYRYVHTYIHTHKAAERGFGGGEWVGLPYRKPRSTGGGPEANREGGAICLYIKYIRICT